MADQVEPDPRFAFRGQSVEWLEAFRAKLWQYITLELDDLGKSILRTYDELNILLALVNGRCMYPDSDVDRFVQQTEEALGESLARFPNALLKSGPGGARIREIHSNSDCGPGGTRTHDPHNADAASGANLRA